LWPEEQVLWSQRPDARGALTAQLHYASRQALEAMHNVREPGNATGLIFSPIVFALAWLRYLWPVEISYIITTRRVLTIYGDEINWLALEHCAEPEVVKHTGEVGSVLFPHDTDKARDLRFDGVRDPVGVVELVLQAVPLPELTPIELTGTVVIATPPSQPAPENLDDGYYGRGTARIREIVLAGRTITWFPPRGPADAVEQALVTSHLASLADAYPEDGLTTRPILWVTGELADFDRFAPTLPVNDAWSWGDPWAITPWGNLLVKLQESVLDRIEQDAVTLDLVRPPLWPLPRRLNLVSESLIASPPPPELQSDACWGMQVHVQSNYWRALEWALLWPERLDRSPFYTLYQLHLAGLYPLGFDESGAFRVFYRARPTSQSV